MQTLPYTDRDYMSVFNDIKDLFTNLEPRADVGQDKANVESIITKIIAGCVDTLSYNQDANILEAFPSTARDIRSVFDLLSIVGYTPKTARSCKVYLTLWNPSYVGSVTYKPFTRLQIDGKSFYNPDTFTCTSGVTSNSEWYQGRLIAPDLKENQTISNNFIDNYYPNLSASTISQNQFALPETQVNIDSRTIRIYTPDGSELTYVENPYLVNVTKASFSLLPTVNGSGYSLIFSDDVAAGVVSDNYYYFYVISEEKNISNNLTPDFSGFGSPTPNFSLSYVQEEFKKPETANEARENVAYEFGWRDTPKAIITKYDAERAILQNHAFVAAVDVRDGNDYSKANPNELDIQVFVKVTEDAEAGLDVGIADSYKNRILTHVNKFKMLPLKYSIHIDNVPTVEGEITTELYHWYPDVTVYLKEQVDTQEANAILIEINNALFNRYNYKNVNFNEVPRIVDIIDTIQNASNIILYLDIDGVYYIDKNNQQVDKEQVTCSYIDTVTIDENNPTVFDVTLNTLNNTRNIQYHTVKIVDANNTVVGFDNGDGLILSQSNYLDDYGSIDYTTGKLTFNTSVIPVGTELYVYYKQETPTFCTFTNNSSDNIKIALESIKI